MDFISGRMVVYIKATGLKTKFKVMANISGMIKEHFKGIGQITICMVPVFIIGQMEDDMKETT